MRYIAQFFAENLNWAVRAWVNTPGRFLRSKHGGHLSENGSPT